MREASGGMRTRVHGRPRTPPGTSRSRALDYSLKLAAKRSDSAARRSKSPSGKGRNTRAGRPVRAARRPKRSTRRPTATNSPQQSRHRKPLAGRGAERRVKGRVLPERKPASTLVALMFSEQDSDDEGAAKRYSQRRKHRSRLTISVTSPVGVSTGMGARLQRVAALKTMLFGEQGLPPQAKETGPQTWWSVPKGRSTTKTRGKQALEDENKRLQRALSTLQAKFETLRMKNTDLMRSLVRSQRLIEEDQRQQFELAERKRVQSLRQRYLLLSAIRSEPVQAQKLHINGAIDRKRLITKSPKRDLGSTPSSKTRGRLSPASNPKRVLPRWMSACVLGSIDRSESRNQQSDQTHCRSKSLPRRLGRPRSNAQTYQSSTLPTPYAKGEREIQSRGRRNSFPQSPFSPPPPDTHGLGELLRSSRRKVPAGVAVAVKQQSVRTGLA